MISLLSSCIQGGGKKRGYVVDYSTTDTNDNSDGCSSTALIEFSSDLNGYSCLSSCSSGYHQATTSEQTNFLTNVSTTIKTYVNAAKGLCISDSSAIRPSGEVYISSDYCSCLNGVPDIANACDSYCASVSNTTAPILHVNTTLGATIAGNSKLGSLYNWCTVQLAGDTGTPNCTLTAYDDSNTIDNIPVNISKSSNSFTADISGLSYDKTYVLKLVESKAGSNASSVEFQIRRIRPSSSNSTSTTLKISPVSQYSCLTYGGSVDPNGVITRTSYAETFYYFPINESPGPIPPAANGGQSQIVCHNESANPGPDSSLYPRLKLIPSAFTLWDKTDAQFVSNNNVLAIHATLISRFYNEYDTTKTSLSLFTPLSYITRPQTVSSSQTATSTILGYMLVPFINYSTNLAYCPTTTQFNGTDPLMRLLKDYTGGDTEGIYLGEKDPEVIQDGNNGSKVVYGTMFVTESILKKYGFYVQNGIKIKATAANLHNKSIYYYWPVNPDADPLLQGDRKLYSVKYYNQLQGNVPSGVSTSITPSDKRIGCVPVTSSN